MGLCRLSPSTASPTHAHPPAPAPPCPCSYIQSRYYRAPEVLVGLPYTTAIDMWSLGCIAVEMFVGLPVFPGVSQHDQVKLISDMLGQPPDWMLQVGPRTLPCPSPPPLPHTHTLPVFFYSASATTWELDAH
jgi:serine/threonine protein kinase